MHCPQGIAPRVECLHVIQSGRLRFEKAHIGLIAVDLALRGRARLTSEASSALRAWPWPGNVRELLAALEAAVVLAPGRVVSVEHLPRALRERSAGRPAARSYREAVNAARVEAIQVALLETKGNRTRAARQLGISRQSLLYEMKKLRIGGDSHRSRVP